MDRSPPRATHRGGAGVVVFDVLAALFICLILASIAVPVFLTLRTEAQDEVAKSLLREGASRMEACAEESGSYSLCDAERMNETQPEIRWFDSVAAVASEDEIGIRQTDLNSYTLQTTSQSGNVFFYAYDDGAVSRTVNRPVGGTADW